MNRNRLKIYRKLSLGLGIAIVSFLLLITRPILADTQNEIHINWRELPVLPSGISAKARAILKGGLLNGYDPRSFSKIGDCYASTSWFIADFDLGEQYYNLGPFEADFAPVIAYYQGSFGTHSLAARPGFTAASLLSPTWLNSASCDDPHGNPLNCELSAQNSLFAIFSIGTNDAFNPDQFKDNMREAIETAIAQKRLPVLMTKADDIEGGHRINQDIADLAAEYELPLVNFWAAVQDLPQKGLQQDGVHLTFYKNDFSDPLAYDAGWTYRNISTLYMLQLIMSETLSVENEIAAERIPEPQLKLAETTERADNEIETVLAARFETPITTVPARQRIANGISNYASKRASDPRNADPVRACLLASNQTAGVTLDIPTENLSARNLPDAVQAGVLSADYPPYHPHAYFPEIREEMIESERSIPEILESNHQTLRLIFPLIAFNKEPKK